MYSAGALISAESLPEFNVERINPDGSEVHEKPPTASEAFCQLVNKIKFQQWDEDLEEFISEGELAGAAADESEDSATAATGADSQRPVTLPARLQTAGGDAANSCWQQVRMSVVSAMDEATALLDLLSAARHRPQALSLEPMQRETEKPEHRVQLCMHGKKKCVLAAAEILQKGLRNLQQFCSEAFGNFELQRVARCWKLRRLANTVSGDLSLRSAGSRYLDSGGFELRTNKAECYEVLLPGHLYGQACVQVRLQTSSGEPVSAVLGVLSAEHRQHQPSRISLASCQRLLLVQELYNTLCCECIHSGIRAGADAVSVPLAPGLCAVVSLHKTVGPEAVQQQQRRRLPRATYLSNALECLLLKRHQLNQAEPGPFPSCAPAGVSEKRREAGPFSRPVPEPTPGLLGQFTAICRHAALVGEVSRLLESWPLAEPRLVWHWQTGCSVAAHVAVEFVRRSYDQLRSRALISIDDHKAVLLTTCGQRVSAHIGDAERLLLPSLLREADRHLLLCVHAASASLGWHLLANSAEPPAACLLRSPDGQCSVSVQVSPADGRRLVVSVGRSKGEATAGTVWRRVRMGRLAGATGLEKLEHVLAALTPLPAG